MAKDGQKQWNVKVRLAELDRGSTVVKNRWSQGETIAVQIEPHATVGMLKQRVALVVRAHEKWQTMRLGEVELDNIAKLQDIEGLQDGSTVDLFAKAPVEAEEDLGVLSDDPDAMEEEAEPAPGLPDDAGLERELSDDEQDLQNKCKQEAADILEDGGDKGAALAKLTEAVMVGSPNAMLLCRRGELLLKLKRPRAAVADADAALKKNPDSAKAYKLRGKAYRYLSDWERAVEDFSQCQKIDYDDAVADMHKYCTKRKVWYAKMAVRKKKEEEAAAEQK